MREELTFIETTLQTSLTTYKTTHTTSLVKVAVLDTNAKEKKYQDYLESQQLTIVYRELPGMLPGMPTMDKVISGNFFVYALENEKEVVVALIDDFISDYNATYQSMNKGAYKAKYNFTNLTPIGRADNKGSDFYQAWQFGVVITIVDSLTSLYNRTVSFNSKSVGIANGLVSFQFDKIPVYAEYPESATGEGKKLRYIKYRVTFTVLDSDDAAVASLRGYVFDSTYSAATVVVSSSSTASFTGKIVQASDKVSEQGFPLLTFVIERG